MNNIDCDWCYQENKYHIPARYVACTGRIDTMRIKEFFICEMHADLLCVSYTGKSGVISGTTFDIWEITGITEKAREFYNRRAAQRLTDAAKRAVRKGNLPYSLTEPNPWGIQRNQWVHRNTGEVRESVSFHGVCVGDGATIWNSSYRRT